MRAALIGEALGTAVLMLFGTGAVASAVLAGVLRGLWQVAAVWGFGVTLAISCSAASPGACSTSASSAPACRGRSRPAWKAADLA